MMRLTSLALLANCRASAAMAAARAFIRIAAAAAAPASSSVIAGWVPEPAAAPSVVLESKAEEAG